MLPPAYVEFLLIHFVYVPSRTEKLMMTRERIKLNGAKKPARRWYLETFHAERSMLPDGTRTQFRDWRIFTADIDLFTVNGVRYDQYYIFVGEEKSYWFFFENEPRNGTFEGSGILTCALCSCCIFKQFPMIVDNVKECIKKRAKPH